MEDRVGNGCGVGFVGFKDKEEAFFVGGDEGGEGSDFLKRLIVLYISEFESPYEGCKTLGAEPLRISGCVLFV